MAIERVVWGWDRSALDATVDYLWSRYARDSIWQLDQTLLVVPGGRVGRGLGERLVREATRRQAVLFPPQILTMGYLPERLYQARRPFASTLVQHLSWSHALQKVSTDCLQAFLTDLPSQPDDPRWLEIGTLLWSQHCELAADGLNFRAVAEQGEQVDGFRESRRWFALAEVQQAYLNTLDELALWDRQTARLFAIEHHECATTHDVLLLGMVDMSRALRQMMDQVSDRVSALIFADRSLEFRFDEYGCVRPEAWTNATIPLKDEQIVRVDGPLGQARAVVRELNELAFEQAGTKGSDETEDSLELPHVTIGVPNEELVPWIERECAAAAIPVRYGPGRSIEATRPVRLVRALSEYLQRQRFDNLLELLHHPDMRNYLRETVPSLTRDQEHLQRYLESHLPIRLSDPWLGSDDDQAGASRLADAVAVSCRMLRGEDRQPAAWVEPLLEWIDQIYGNLRVNGDSAADRGILGGYEALRDGFMELDKMPAMLSAPLPAWQAILMALVVISTRQVAAPPDANAVEVLGWLELPWDDARFLIVTQLNEGTVPTSANSDLFLPNALRQNLGLDDNSRRYARDAYALHALTCSRQKLVVIVASRNAEGYPILPSRLLFAASDEVRAGRCLRFFSEHGTSEQSEEMADAVLEGQGAVEVEADGGGPLPAGERPQLLSVPFPLTEVEVDSFRVTDFRAYLACPYRFYLEKVLRLSEVIKQKNELDGGAFGSLLHQVLEAFGKSNVRDAELPHKIEEFLLEAMRELFTEQYGDRIRPAVKIQQSQMKLRLKEFAQRQAAWRQAGWRIERTEVESTTLNTPWRSEFPSVSLRGRIDRIDRHESTNEYAILDYKSSDKVRSPRDVHHKEGKPPVLNMEKWRDLQLPLYRHLVSELNIQGKASLGFILLPRDLDAVGFVMADWSDAELAIADQVANRVVRNVRSRVFWPPIVHKDARSFNASIERICQIGVFDRRLGESPSDMDPRLISSTDR